MGFFLISSSRKNKKVKKEKVKRGRASHNLVKRFVFIFIFPIHFPRKKNPTQSGISFPQPNLRYRGAMECLLPCDDVTQQKRVDFASRHNNRIVVPVLNLKKKMYRWWQSQITKAKTKQGKTIGLFFFFSWDKLWSDYLIFQFFSFHSEMSKKKENGINKNI